MIQRHHQAAILLEELAVLLADLKVRADDLHGADAAQTHDDLGLHQCPLPLEIALAGVLLRVQRVAVLGRAALDDVGDIAVLFAVQVDGEEVFVQQLAAAAHKGQALLILALAGAFAHEQYLGVLGTLTEHHVGAGLAQLAAGAGKTA